MTVTVSTLAVPGASLYYEVRGSGPLVLLVCGGIYDAAALAPLAELLAADRTVVSYDRRGNSRSPLTGDPVPQEVAVHADDAHRLLAEVGGGPAVAVGNSSGAQIVLDLAARYPTDVTTVVAHEPPLLSLLADAPRFAALLDEVQRTFDAEDTDAAMAVFADGLGRDDQPAVDPATLPPHVQEMLRRFAVNTTFFVGWEVPSFGRWLPDVDALRAGPVRVVPAVGATSVDQPPHRAAQVLADELGVDPLVLPGGHGGFGEDPAGWADALRRLLADGPAPS